MPNSRTVPPQGATFQQYSLQKAAHMVVSQHRKTEQDERGPVAIEDLPQPNDRAQRKYKQEGDDEDAGFTRSISLYWHWVRCQRAAARLGKGLNRNSTALILQCEHWLEAADPKHRYGTNLRPYFDYWLNQQAKARDAATALHTYIPYSAIPEIAAQAAAAALQLREGSNNNTCPAADAAATPTDPSALDDIPCSSTTAATSNGAAAAPSTTEQQLGHPTTPRRSRSAPSFAELLSNSTATAAGDAPPADAMQEDDSDRFQSLATPSSITAAAAIPLSSSSTKQQLQSNPCASEATRAASLNIGPATLPGIHTDDRFFYWLDEGSGRHVDLGDRGVPRTKLELERVQYLTESERDQLEVTVDAESGLLIYKISGQTVHTGVELSVVQLKGSTTAGDGSSDVAIAAAAAAAGQCLQGITEAAEEEEEEEIEQQSEEDEQQQSEDDEQQGSPQKQQRRQQKAALRQMQEQIRQPLNSGQHHHQQQQQQLVRQCSLQQQQQQCLQENASGPAVAQQRQQGLAAELDAVMVDADAAAAAACASPDRVPAGFSVESAVATVAATPTVAAYGAVAGQHTPGTTGISQRRASFPLAAAAAEQQQECTAACSLHQQQQTGAICNNSSGHNHSGGINPPGLLQIKEKPCKWIYVLDTSGRLFVHAKYRGKFHHSSFLQGGAVLSAGGIVVEHGRIVKLTADSGHYRPNFDNFMGTVQLLKDWGADLTQTKLSAKHIKCPQMPDLPPN